MEFLHSTDEPRARIAETALELVFGLGHSEIPDRAHARQSCPRAPDAEVVILWGASAFAARELQRRGYQIVRRFVVLPSRANPKFLLPCDNRHAASSALRAHTAYSRRLRKGVTVTAAALGWPCMRRSTVLVASRRASRFGVIAQEATGQKELEVAIYFGSPGVFRKMCVQWMRSGGEAVCHLKLPLTAKANARILHEAAMLDVLWRCVHFRRCIPRIVHSGAIDGTQFVVQSALEGEAGPVEFGPCHENLLRVLHQYRPSRKPGHSVVQDVAERFRQNMSRLGRPMADSRRRCSSHGVTRTPQQFGRLWPEPWRLHALEHPAGKWTPFSLRLGSGRVECPCLWDKLHFLTQTRSLLRKGAGIPLEMTSERHALYLLYLLDSAAKLAADETESNGVAYRESELLKHLRLRSQSNSTQQTSLVGIGEHLDPATCDRANSMEAVGKGN